MNQRQYKFRAWDPEANCMLDEWMLAQDYSYMIPEPILDLRTLVQVYDLDIMQFSGFYDARGREIYDGDILLSQETLNPLDNELFELTFELGGYCLADYPRSAEGGDVFYRNWFSRLPVKEPDFPQPACAFLVVGHRHEERAQVEARVAEIHEAQSEADGIET